jgi:hypothetical protein
MPEKSATSPLLFYRVAALPKMVAETTLISSAAGWQ